MTEDNTSPDRLDYEYVYHWDRIIGAVVAIALVVGATLWYLDDEAPDTTVTAAVVTPAAETGNSVVVPLQSPVQAKDAVATPAVVEPAPTTSTPADPVTPPADPTPQEAAAATNLATTSDGIIEGMRPGEVRNVSRGVSDAALNQVIDQESLALEKGSISIGKRKAVRVVFSAKVTRPGEAITFHWYHNGKPAASVKTRVSPESLALGSKYVSYDTPGDWQVHITDAKHTLLAVAAFKARRI